MSVDFSEIYGNDLLKGLLSESISDNKLPHAIILEGPKGSGRYTLALHIAAACLCGQLTRPCYQCKNCKQIFEGVAPDVTVITLPEDKATIPVESVRVIKSDAQKIPVEGELKFYIIRDADKMTVQAQNALLKILEEPPSFVVFILLSENVNLLLSTIRSRACAFRMQLFEDEALAEYVMAKYPQAVSLRKTDEASFNRIIKSSNGCIGAVASNLDKRSFTRLCDEYTLVKDMLTALCGNSKSGFMHYEDDVPSKREELRGLLGALRTAMRDILSVKKGFTQELMFFDEATEAKKIGKSLTLVSVVSIIDAIDATLNSNEQNANVNLLKINFMNTLWKCVH